MARYLDPLIAVRLLEESDDCLQYARENGERDWAASYELRRDWLRGFLEMQPLDSGDVNRNGKAVSAA